MSNYSFTWQILSNSNVLDVVSPFRSEKREIEEVTSLVTAPLLRDTLSDVTLDDLKLKKINVITKAFRAAKRVFLIALVCLIVSPFGVVVNGVRTLKALIECRIKKGEAKGNEKVKAFSNAFFQDLQAFTSALLPVFSVIFLPLLISVICLDPMIPLGSKVVLTGCYSMGIVGNGCFLGDLDPLSMAPERDLGITLALREQFALVKKGGGLFSRSEANQFDFELKNGNKTYKGALIEKFKEWYFKADQNLKNLSPDTSKNFSVKELKKHYKGQEGILKEIEKNAFIKDGVWNKLYTPLFDYKDDKPKVEDLSFTKRALLNRHVLKWIMPSNCQEMQLQQGHPSSEKKIYSSLCGVDITAKVKEVNLLTKAFRAVRRVVVIGTVTLIASPCGAVVNGLKALTALVSRAIKKNPTDEDSQKVDLYAKAFFKDIKAFVLGSYAVFFVTVGVFMIGAGLFAPIPLLAAKVFVVALGVFEVSAGAFGLGFFNPSKTLSRIYLGDNETKKPLYMALELYNQFGLTDENGDLLTFSKADHFDKERVDGKVTYTDSLLNLLKNWVDNEALALKNQETRSPVENRRSKFIIQKVNAIVKELTGSKLDEINVC